MEHLSQWSGRLAHFNGILKALLVFTTGLVLLGWWMYVPPGLLGKADAAGYAVCHRIDVRSFHIGDRPTPLCARCSGMYLGGLLGIVYLSRFGKRAGLPSLKISIVLAAFLAAFAFDGVNSFLHLAEFPGIFSAFRVYEPNNTLRLFTGTGLGLGIAAVLVPVFHQSIWPVYDGRSALSGWKTFLPLLLLAGLLDAAVLSDNPLLLYPLALLSGASILLILAMVYAVVWIMIAKRENRIQRYRELWVPLTAGFLTAILQIFLIDAGRLWLTGTWSGFIF